MSNVKSIQEIVDMVQEMRDKHSSATGDQYCCGQWDMAQRIIGKLNGFAEKPKNIVEDHE